MSKLPIEQTLRRAKSHVRKGEIAQARALFSAILAEFPNNVTAKQELAKLDSNGMGLAVNPPQAQVDHLLELYNGGKLPAVLNQGQALVAKFPNSIMLWNILGAVYAQLGHDDAALTAFQKMVELAPTLPDAHYNLGNILIQMGRQDEAIVAFRQAIELRPDFAEALNNLGNILLEQDRLAEAIATYRRLISVRSTYAEAHNNLGVAFRKQGNLPSAVAAYRRAIELRPDYAEAYLHLGNALSEQGQHDQAVDVYRYAIKIRPQYAEAHTNLGSAFAAQGRLKDALAAHRCAIEISPDYADAHYNMGLALKALGNITEEAAAYRRAIELRPDFVEAHYNLSVTMSEQGALNDAFAECKRSIVLKPDFAEAYNNLGTVLRRLGRLDEATTSFQRAIDLKPEYVEAYYNIGNALAEQGNIAEAIAAYRHALKVKPDHAQAEAQLLHQNAHICDWRGLEYLAIPPSSLGINTQAVPPFTMLSVEDDAERQMLRAKVTAREKYQQEPLSLPSKLKRKHERLRIGYFSADFHDHATLYLLSGVLREHDKSSFEIFAYSFGRVRHGIMRDNVINEVHHFADVTDISNRDIVELARRHEIDIALDLKGYSRDNRFELFQYRLAPIQMNYLVYPGTLGAECIDYIVADSVLVPDDLRCFYTENVIYMPHSYQPNDNRRMIAATKTTRADFGLPEGAFVFCCFNNSYKISSREFDIWMRLLAQVEGSVLWLLQSTRWSQQNLRNEAGKSGIESSRLVFAGRLGHEEHLARHKHADLFIDTFNVNAHTTTSDALWAGLPVVTKIGQQFAARVSASLLTAVGLPELIANSEEEYEAKILELARDHQKLAGIRTRLSANRTTMPLFDTVRYTRNFEAGMRAAFDLYAEGKDAQDIVVREKGA